MAVLLLCAAETSPATAAEPSGSAAAEPPAVASTASGSNAKLIAILVRRGVLTPAEADDILKEAAAEAATAPPTAPPPSPAAPMRVTYVPEVVKKQLREEIKQQVMAQAKEEKWAAPNTFPDWAQRIHFYGDVRLRYEGASFPTGNDNTGAFANFNAINTGAPFDTSATATIFSPQLDVDQDRNRFRLLARFGVDADLGDGVTTGIRLATGDSSSSVSANQTLGFAGSGQAGNFSKYALWLDRAFIRYEPAKEISITAGRFDNVFLSSDLIWDRYLGFDGVVIEAKAELGSGGIAPFLVAGAFPIFNTDLNFGTNNPAKFRSHDKYLLGGQIGVDARLEPELRFKAGVAYYEFEGVEGKLSSPCVVVTAADSCDTDVTRPSFAQKGNTYRALRNIVPTAANGFGTTNQLQYFGLATPFREIAVTGRLDYSGFAWGHIRADAEFVKNVAFDATAIGAVAVNNRATTSALSAFAGGDTGYTFRLTLGTPTLAERWDWNAYVGYKYLESDAVVDAFTDSNFGLGGTNLKGYFVGGSLALSRYLTAGARWYSADSVAGPPFAVDVVQVDLNARF